MDGMKERKKERRLKNKIRSTLQLIMLKHRDAWWITCIAILLTESRKSAILTLTSRLIPLLLIGVCLSCPAAPPVAAAPTPSLPAIVLFDSFAKQTPLRFPRGKL